MRNNNVFAEFLVDRLPERSRRRKRTFRLSRRPRVSVVIPREASCLLDRLQIAVMDGSWSEYIASRRAIERYIAERQKGDAKPWEIGMPKKTEPETTP